MYVIIYRDYAFFMKSKILAQVDAEHIDLSTQYRKLDIVRKSSGLEEIDRIMKSDLHNVTKNDKVNEVIKKILPELYL